MKKSNLLFYVAFLAIFISSCSDDEGGSEEPNGDYENGYFVTNEGPFQNGSGTITFVEDGGPVSQNVYKKVNNEDLGNIVNSMFIEGEKGYIVVNNSNKVVVVNKNTMEKEAIIEGNEVVSPRFFVAERGIGYLSNWGDPNNPTDDFISVVNLETNKVIKKIAVGEGPERMLLSLGKLFVCLKGGYGFNNKVIIIDTTSNTILSTIEVGDVPNSLVEDNNASVWVLCEGVPAWTQQETAGSLYRINALNLSSSFFEFNGTDHPQLLNSEAGILYYYLNGEVYPMNVSDTELPVDYIEGLGGSYYSLKVYLGEVYATDAGDYQSEGTLKVFNLVSGDLMQTISTGIVPGQIVFP